MAIILSILTFYGLLAIFYFIFKYLPKILLYVLMAPVIVVSPFIVAHRQIKLGKKAMGYSLYFLASLLYIFFIALAIF